MSRLSLIPAALVAAAMLSGCVRYFDIDVTNISLAQPPAADAADINGQADHPWGQNPALIEAGFIRLQFRTSFSLQREASDGHF